MTDNFTKVQKLMEKYGGEKQKYESLSESINEYENGGENSVFWNDILPFLVKYLLQADVLFQENEYLLPILQRNNGNQKVSLSRKQALVINIMGFFNLFVEYDIQNADINSNGKENIIKVGSIDFLKLQQSEKFVQEAKERLKCLYSYFEECLRSEDKLEKFNVEFYRKELSIAQVPDWKELDVVCDTQVEVQTNGIEQTDAFYQVDFANKNLQVHKIIPSCTQEEIMFSIRPDCYISLLIFDTLQKNEAAVIQGAKIYSKYTGYSQSFQFAGKQDGLQNEQISSIIAIDALENVKKVQYKDEFVQRELNKSYIGFKALEQNEIAQEFTGGLNIDQISTGNWGCGIFGGDFTLKFLEQMISAKIANKKLVYSSYNNKISQKKFEKLANRVKELKLTVKQLYGIIVQYYEKYSGVAHNLYFEEYIEERIIKNKEIKKLYIADKEEDEMMEEIKKEMEQNRQ